MLGQDGLGVGCLFSPSRDDDDRPLRAHSQVVNNSYKGKYVNEKGKAVTWPLYLSSPMLIGHFAQQGGYGIYWAGKTQMAGDLREFGFDQGCFTPGSLADKDNPYTDFRMIQKEIAGSHQQRHGETI